MLGHVSPRYVMLIILLAAVFLAHGARPYNALAESAADTRLKGIEVKNGESVEKAVDFSFGELSVKVTRNGALSDATVSVYEPGTKNFVAGGRSYTKPESNPKKMSLTPGSYVVSVRATKMADNPEESYDIQITGGKEIEIEADFTDE